MGLLSREVPFRENQFRQLMEFSSVVSKVLEYIKNPSSNYEEALGFIEDSNLGNRQKEFFQEGAKQLFERREKVKKVKEEYQKEYGDEYVKKLFLDLFHTTGTFGDIKVLDNPDCLIFLCDSHLDFLQASNPTKEGQKDAYSQFQESGMSLEDIPSSLEMGAALGVFIANSDLSVVDTNLSKAVIAVNVRGVEERKEDLDSVIRHELQHAENHLYYRPKSNLEGFVDIIKSIQKKIDQDIGTLKELTCNNYEKLKEKEQSMVLSEKEREKILMEGLDQEKIAKMKEIAISTLEKITKDMSDLVKKYIDSAREAIIKEEIIAFFFSGSSNENISDMLPLYLSQLRKNIGIVKDHYETILHSFYPDSVIEELGLKDPGFRRSVRGMLSLGDSFGFNTEEIETDGNFIDRVFLDTVFRPFEKFVKEVQSEIDLVLKLLDEVKEKSGNDLEKDLQAIKPILISQPLGSWKGNIDMYFQMKK